MILTGAIVNAVTVLVCSIIGTLSRKGIPERFQSIIVAVLGAVTSFLGIQSALQTKNILIVIVCLVIGSVLGELIDIDKQLNQFGDFLQNKLKSQDKIAEGFVVSTLLFCVGTMTIMGSIESGTLNDHTILFTKSIMDGVMAVVFAGVYGIGVAFSAVVILLYQGGLTLLAGSLAPHFQPHVLAEISATGGIILLLMGMNIMKIREEPFKIANMLPALFLPLLMPLFGL